MAIRNSVFGAVQEHLLQGEGFRIPSIKIAMTELFFPLVYINSHEGKKIENACHNPSQNKHRILLPFLWRPISQGILYPIHIR